MTALAGFERLEAEATYAAGPEAEAEAVLLKFGDASLTILRFDETPIDHWPLASLRRVKGPGKGLTLAPDQGAPDRLHLVDGDMIAAIKAVARGLDAPTPQPKRGRRRGLRRAIAVAVLAAVAAGGWLAWPRALDAIAAATPPAVRAALGDAAMGRVLGAQACRDPAALRALRRWSARVSAATGAPVRLSIGAGATTYGALAAPGGRIALSVRLLEAEDPAPAAALLGATLDEAAARPPMAAALAEAGAAGLLELLRGAPDGPALTAGAAATMVSAPPNGPDGAAPAATPAEWAAIRRGCGR